MTPSERTVQILRCLASHLSSRKSCKQVEYTVCIGCTETGAQLFTNSITLNPHRQVFPDTYHRKQSDLIDVAEHVLIAHFPDIAVDSDVLNVQYAEGSLVTGVYRYILSFDKSRRQWIRII